MNGFLDLLASARWSPYAVGIGIGVLSWLTFLLSDHPLGVSTAFARSAGMIEKKIRGPRAAEKPYYRKNEPAVDWEWMLVLGLLVGALTSALVSQTFKWEWVPGMWETAFGTSTTLRLAAALFGGICVGFGARWGKGCTSGHGISGTLQLVLSSWLASACFFVGGIGSAYLIYRVL